MRLRAPGAGLILMLLAGCDPPGMPDGSAGSVWFAEEASARGITFQHVSGENGRYMIPEITGSGAALVDLDGDGDLDAYIVQSGSLIEDAGVHDHVFINQGDGLFEAAEPPPDSDGYGMGVAAGDYDNDGDVDLSVTNLGANLLLRNDGSGNFENVAAGAGVDEPGWGTSAAFLDLDADGDLDLYVTNYIQWRLDAELQCYMAGVQTFCPPQNYKAPAPDHLFRNNGDGTFTNVSRRAGLPLAFGNGFGIVSADYDQNGLADVYIANDMMANQLWLNRGDLRFTESAMEWGSGVDAAGEAKVGMGVAAADLDDDSDVDILVVNLEGQSDSLFRNAGAWFDDATADAGLNVVSRRFTRFGVVFADFDNDGWLDMYQANGGVSHIPDSVGDPFAEPNVLYLGEPGGRFALVTPEGGTADALVHTSRGLAVGDVDGDGGADLLVINRDAQPYLLMNRVEGRGNWIRFRVLTGTGRDAHAATVSALVGGQRKYRDVQPAASYLSSNDPRVHFGLGSVGQVTDVRVLWPGGSVEVFGDFDAGAMVTLIEGEGKSEVVARPR